MKIMRENAFFLIWVAAPGLASDEATKHAGVAQTGSGQNSFETIVLPRQAVAAKQVPSSET